MNKITPATKQSDNSSAQMRRRVSKKLERKWAEERKELILDLVGLPDDSCERFRNQFPSMALDLATVDDKALLAFRDQLQRMWSGEDSMGAALSNWCHELNHTSKATWWLTSWADGTYSIHPDYGVFLVSLAIGAGEWFSKMAVCENPDCTQKYFLKPRKTQRFCDIPACIAYGQREHKRVWWTEHGKEHRRRKSHLRKGKKR